MSELEPFREHLEELRRRVLRIVVVIGAITAVLLTVHLEPVELWGLNLAYPTMQPLDNIAAQITQHMRDSLVPQGVQMIQTAPGQAFFAQIYIAALAGLVAGMPVMVRELVGFIGPALRENEIRVGRSVTMPAMGLFAAGVLFAYFVAIPYILEILYTYGYSAGLVTFLNVMDFVAFVLQFMIAFGLSFQLPLIMYAATASGMADAGFWRRNFRYAIVAIVIFGAAITPDGTGVTMAIIAGPMIALYLAGMKVAERHEKKPGTLKS